MPNCRPSPGWRSRGFPPIWPSSRNADLVRDRRAGVSAYYRFNEDSLEPAERGSVAGPARAGTDDPLLRQDAERLTAVLANARLRRELGRLGGRRHGAPLLARPHLGSAGARRPAPARARRSARRRLRRRRARRTAGAACAPLSSAWTASTKVVLAAERAPAQARPRRGARGRHAGPALRQAAIRPGAADACPDLRRAAGAGRCRSGARAAPGRSPARLPAWPSTSTRARSTPYGHVNLGFTEKELRRFARKAGLADPGLRSGDPREAAAALRSPHPAGAQGNDRPALERPRAASPLLEARWPNGSW